jgi:hypothetical protein
MYSGFVFKITKYVDIFISRSGIRLRRTGDDKTYKDFFSCLLLISK